MQTRWQCISWRTRLILCCAVLPLLSACLGRTDRQLNLSADQDLNRYEKFFAPLRIGEDPCDVISSLEDFRPIRTYVYPELRFGGKALVNNGAEVTFAFDAAYELAHMRTEDPRLKLSGESIVGMPLSRLRSMCPSATVHSEWGIAGGYGLRLARRVYAMVYSEVDDIKSPEIRVHAVAVYGTPPDTPFRAMPEDVESASQPDHSSMD